MSGYHYTKSGALDMRYSSSRAAVSSGSYGNSSSSYSSSARGSSTPSYSGGGGGGSSSSSKLHYTKDGSLDMRYSSSRAATSSGSYGNSSSSPAAAARDYSASSYSVDQSSSGDLHYKKDGTLDMRYSSSKQAASSSSVTSNLYSSTSKANQTSSDTLLHYKKDGSLDMRYSSSRQAASSSGGGGGTAIKSINKAMNKMTMKNSIPSSGIPSHVPLTKKGLPDMRTAAAKDWVAKEAASSHGQLPQWVPRRKDGSVDTTKAAAQEFFKCARHGQHNQDNDGDIRGKLYDENQRQKYYQKKLKNDFVFAQCVQGSRNAVVPPPNYDDTIIILGDKLKASQSLFTNFKRIHASSAGPDGGSGTAASVHIEKALEGQIDLNLINYSDIDFGRQQVELGRGGFGVVIKGKWQGLDVAVKKMHLQKLTVKEKKSFITEVTILGCLSQHPNLVTLYGYTLDPLSIVLEFVGLGSLNHLLHYNEKPEIEAKMTDGRIKQRLIVGIVQGMIQLHSHNVVHSDLKPANILVSEDYVAKIADFGLASIRGKTSATIASKNLIDEDNGVGGTAGYMAIELLDSTGPPELSSDVYSFGILMNEVIEEEEPYSDQYQNFLGRGPFAAVNYAKLGNRPRCGKQSPSGLQRLIKKCWSVNPSERPTFKEILEKLKRQGMDFPNSF